MIPSSPASGIMSRIFVGNLPRKVRTDRVLDRNEGRIEVDTPLLSRLMCVEGGLCFGGQDFTRLDIAKRDFR